MKLETILTIAIPIYSFFAVLIGVWIGHKLTLKAFAHVQPSTKEMAKITQSRVSVEPDWVDEAYEDLPVEKTPEEESKIKQLFKKKKIPNAIYDAYIRAKKDPANFLGFDTLYPKGDVEEEIKKESA